MFQTIEKQRVPFCKSFIIRYHNVYICMDF